jgi:hypothetical protein
VLESDARHLPIAAGIARKIRICCDREQADPLGSAIDGSSGHFRLHDSAWSGIEHKNAKNVQLHTVDRFCASHSAN